MPYRTSPEVTRRFTVSPARQSHILDGDRTGGGHRFAAGRGKSEFPQTWSDEFIINTIEDVANDPASTHIKGRGDYVRFIAMRNFVSITVVVDVVNADIITGYPT